MFNVLNDINQERLKGILGDLEKGDVAEAKDPTLKDDCEKLCSFYSAAMNEEQIEKEGLAKLLPLLEMAQSVNSANIHKVVATLHDHQIDVLFGVYAANDKANSEHTLADFHQSGLGLPDRDYYFDADKADKREKYLVFVEQLLSLSGEGDAGLAAYKAGSGGARKAAEQVFAFETALAKFFLTKTERRDEIRAFNKMNLADLNAKVMPQEQTWGLYLARGETVQADAFDFIEYMRQRGLEETAVGTINVSTIEPLQAMARLLRRALLDGTIAHYFTFHILKEYGSHVHSAVDNSLFGFYKKTIQGTKEQNDRWKRALEWQEGALGFAMGKIYVAKYFDSDCKQKALDVVEAVRDALRQRLNEVEWMSEETRVNALQKMEKFRVKIGYPDQWVDYTTLSVSKGSHVGNMLASARFDSARDLARMNQPTDRERWFMCPQRINAYYHPMLNEIVFPAAILEAPFFDREADTAVQFGGFGCVVAHEMTHGFDDKGRLYNKDGALKDWWAGNDGEEYTRRAQVMIDQASQHEVFGTKLKGELTQGENIADLGGVKLSLLALQKRLDAGLDTTRINGFTPHQRFFLAWSQVWRQNATKENALAMVTMDPHGPSELRCNNTLSNVPEFLKAFNVTETDPMGKYMAKKAYVDIW